MQAICEAEMETTPSFAEGQTNFPRSNLFAYRDRPTPSCQRIFARSPLRPLKTYRSPAWGSRFNLLLNLKRQALHASAHVGVAHRDPDAASRGNRDHDRKAFKAAPIADDGAPG